MERQRTLAAVCDTFLPGDGTLPSASALGVPAVLYREVTSLNRPALTAELDRLLDTIESPRMNLALTGKAVRFTGLSLPAREEYLRHWATSRLPQKRQAFQVLKRLTLLYGYGLDHSPYWRLAGYRPQQLPEAVSRANLRIRSPRPAEQIDADVCVIGSGPGGSVVAVEMARQGKRVVVLERATFQGESDFDGGELRGFSTLFYERGIASTQDRAIVLLAGNAVGGGSVVNWSTCLRLPPSIREEWRSAGLDDDLDPHYEAVEDRLDVDANESPRNGPNAALERGLEHLGISAQTIRRNVRGCGDCGPCGFGCRLGAKQSTMRTYLVDACRDGAQILHGCEARRIDLLDGRVIGVLARVAGGEIRVRAPIVALAGGSLLSPALLLRSGIAGEQAGRQLHLHPTVVVAGVYQEPIRAWEGVPQSVLGDAFAELTPGYGFRLECPPTLPGILAASLPWWGGTQHATEMKDAAHIAPFILIARDREDGRVSIDGQGEPVVTYRVRGQTASHLVRAMVEASRVHLAAGALRVSTLHTPPLAVARDGNTIKYEAEIRRRGISPNRVAVFSAHQMSSCRIGRDRRTSVANPDGQVWDVPGLFITDASAFPSASGVNPMLSVMALARRTASRMVT